MSKIHNSIIILLFSILLGCKKNEPLPEMGMGNDLNPASGVNPVKLDSVINNYFGSTKSIKIYYKVDIALLNSLNTGLQGVKVYRDGTYYTTANANQKYIWDYMGGIVAGHTYVYDFIVVTTGGKETKPSTFSITAQ